MHCSPEIEAQVRYYKRTKVLFEVLDQFKSMAVLMFFMAAFAGVCLLLAMSVIEYGIWATVGITVTILVLLGVIRIEWGGKKQSEESR